MVDEKKKPSPAELEEELEEALEATFPASDPIAIGEVSATEPDRPKHRKPAKIDKALVEELARNVAAKHQKVS